MDWKAIDKLSQFLMIFYNSTLVVSASTSLNAHKCYGEIVTIATNLIGLSSSPDPDLKSKASEMFKKFDKYWGGLKHLNMMLVVATVFDPSNKLELAKMCFEELYGSDSVEYKEMYDSLIGVLRSLFKEYSARHGGGGDLNDQFSQTNNSSQSREQCIERMEMVDDRVGYKRMDVRYKQKLNEIGIREKKDELEPYLKESVENPDLMIGVEFDVLSWWRKNKEKFPVLSEIARDVLAMQVSSVASESAFSTSGRLLEPQRSCLTHFMVEVLMCTEQWLKQDLKMESRQLTNAQVLSDLEEIDRLEREYGQASSSSNTAIPQEEQVPAEE